MAEARGGILALGMALLLAGCAGQAPTAQPTGEPTLGATAQPTASAPGSQPPATTSPAPASPGGTVGPTLGATPPLTPEPTASGGLLDGTLAWSELAVEGGPSAREDHTFTVAGTGSSAYLFGGRAGRQAFDDLWRYDLATDRWERLEPAGPRPEARFGHVAAWVDGVGLVVWSGQQSARVFFADIWAFDPATGGWQQLPDDGDAPEARYGSCGGLGPDGRLWISHGFTEDSGRFFDTRAYDFESLAWTDLTPDGELPVLRCLHRCLWSPEGQLVLYGGQTTGAPAIGDLWSLDPATVEWSRAGDPPAPARQLYSVAQTDGVALIFGGGDANGDLLDDLWLLDLGSLEMRPAEVESGGPGARFGASLIADPSRGRMLLFGGKGEAGELSDLWEISPADR